jgi:hypothetical protein
MRMNTLLQVACVLPLLAVSAGATAAEDEWQHSLAAYFVAASIDGQAGVRGLTADVDVPFHDIMDNLDGGLMLAYRGEHGRYAVMADLIFLGQKQEADGLGYFGRTKATAKGDQLIVELDGAYLLTDQLSVYAGLRYWDLDVDIDIHGGGPLGQTLSASGDETWVDPLVGLRYVWAFADRWSLVAKGDVGGFGIGSDMAWQATAFANWQWTEHANLMLGYRYIDVDYDENEANGQFLWDVSQSGPAVGFAWKF